METIVCSICYKRPVRIKKWGLCARCYQKRYMDRSLKIQINSNLEEMTKKEMAFVKNYFSDRTDWDYAPATFKLNGYGKYTPDFYDRYTHCFIEVAGTRQAFFENKKKYFEFVKTFPEIKFQVMTSDGSIVDFTLDRQPKGTWNYNIR